MKEILMEITSIVTNGEGFERFNEGELKTTQTGITYIVLCEKN